MPKPVVIHPALEAFHDNLLDGLEFCRLAYSCYDEIASLPDDGHMLRERRGHVKKVIEELLPICRYIHAFYGPGRYISVRWIDGKQFFDAKVEAKGMMVDLGMWPAQGTLEVTQAVHENEHLMRELLNTKGGGFGLNGLQRGEGKRGAREIKSEPTSYSNYSFIDEMCDIVIKAIEAKVVKLKKGDYPGDTTLIVGCSLITGFLQNEWENLIAMVRAKLSPNGFVHIFLTADQSGFFATL